MGNEKKKISILTFQESHNYGALLQAYALQSTIQRLGADTEIINYHSINKEMLYKGKFDKRQSLFANINNLLSFGFRKRRNKRTNEFREKRLCITNEIYTQKNQLEEYSKSRDFVVCGSDQVWNYNSTNSDCRYLLDFVEPSKRIAYAPSFGVSKLPDEQKNTYKENLKDFSAISVREESGAKIIKELLDEEAKVVLDPCLLLNRNDWTNLLNDCKNIGRKYIFVYYIKYSKELVNYAKEVSKITKLPVIISARTPRDLKDGFKDYNLGVEDFVNTIKNAEYVITNSFHGTVFSLIFNKKFVSFLDKRKSENTSSRIYDLLGKVNLTNRIISNSSDTNLLKEDWDYDSVEKIIDSERKKSINYIRDSIK